MGAFTHACQVPPEQWPDVFTGSQGSRGRVEAGETCGVRFSIRLLCGGGTVGLQALLMCMHLIAGGCGCGLRFSICTWSVVPSPHVVGQPPALPGVLQHITDCLAVFGGAGLVHSRCLRQHGLLRSYLGQVASEFSYAASDCCLACAMELFSQFGCAYTASPAQAPWLAARLARMVLDGDMCASQGFAVGGGRQAFGHMALFPLQLHTLISLLFPSVYNACCLCLQLALLCNRLCYAVCQMPRHVVSHKAGLGRSCR